MSKEPQLVLPSIYAFPPNRYTLGGTAYLIVKNQGNILIDCPIWDEFNFNFIRQWGGVQTLVLTHRGGMSTQLPQIYESLKCSIVVQEQEAYLVSQTVPFHSFYDGMTWESGDRLIWTPGHSPGSACFYYAQDQGILFTGRHLLPNLAGDPQPLKTSKTFHWPRQLRSVDMLLAQFSPETLAYILPGANTGLLRGKKLIAQAYEKLKSCQTHLGDL